MRPVPVYKLDPIQVITVYQRGSEQTYYIETCDVRNGVMSEGKPLKIETLKKLTKVAYKKKE